jgi:hypothetical protein
MAKETYQKIDIAHEYLDMAMQLYMEKRDFFCAIHLAGAAEEIFGSHLQKEQRISHLAVKAQIQILAFEAGATPEYQEAKNMVLSSKNKIKHMDGDEDSTILIDPVFQARRWIDDALTNLYTLQEYTEKLKRPKSATQWKYEDYINAETSG